jgi:hypothetical protein
MLGIFIEQDRQLKLIFSGNTLITKHLQYKKIKKCKPISRVLFLLLASSYHLSSLRFTPKLYRPTRQHRASHPQALAYLVFQLLRFTLPQSSPTGR